MSMSVLVCDKSVPFATALAVSLRAKDHSVALLVDSGDVARGEGSSTELREIPWNRPSALSAQTVSLALRNAFRILDHAVVAFDAASISVSDETDERMRLVAVSDLYIRGYLLLVHELSDLFARQGRGRITFAVRGVPSGSRPREASALVAESAFIRLAEETAAALSASGNSAIQTSLVRLDGSDGDQDVEWLLRRLEGEVTLRSQLSWVKSGSRFPFVPA
jgi:hypothetical protein